MIKKILYIDDDRMVLDLVRQALVSSGYHVETACSGNEGIARFDKFDCDLVITDIFMPDGDGNHVATHIRRSSLQHIPVIAVSGTPWHLDGRLFDDILVKPFSIKALLHTIGHLSCAKPAQRVHSAMSAFAD